MQGIYYETQSHGREGRYSGRTADSFLVDELIFAEREKR
ncbi:hypothetical protein Tph_c06430 [Thermacetogenium phaeum DSM 12270]|uniref:Uncharacterized protein n=1 Tax=Thermacetogenium phaeum (strain ATCC BAA-254 / DSM 26808 / PB) TaxID=1089553 RepID=K4LFM3_THEPS|nr:hypothetical protein Tph_c06430 [Thermacetogenium phaeum DSM 12270]